MSRKKRAAAFGRSLEARIRRDLARIGPYVKRYSREAYIPTGLSRRDYIAHMDEATRAMNRLVSAGLLRRDMPDHGWEIHRRRWADREAYDALYPQPVRVRHASKASSGGGK